MATISLLHVAVCTEKFQGVSSISLVGPSRCLVSSVSMLGPIAAYQAQIDADNLFPSSCWSWAAVVGGWRSVELRAFDARSQRHRARKKGGRKISPSLH